MLHHYLDADTVSVEDYIDDSGWVSTERSDIQIEEAIKRTQVDARRCLNGEQNNSFSRFILHSKLTNPMSPTKISL